MSYPADEEDPILRKIRKCLALASSSVPGEAEAALRQAQKLMAKHGLDAAALERESIGEARIQGTRGIRPAVWESSLVQLCCCAFGARVLWARGPRGGKGAADNGHWVFLATRAQVELVTYTYTVLARQLLKARGEFVGSDAVRPYWTRVQKAAEADAFCEGYVSRLSAKVSPMELEEGTVKALEAKSSELCGPAPTSSTATRNGYGSGAAHTAGQAAGDRAHFHKATTAAAPRKELTS